MNNDVGGEQKKAGHSKALLPKGILEDKSKNGARAMKAKAMKEKPRVGGPQKVCPDIRRAGAHGPQRKRQRHSMCWGRERCKRGEFAHPRAVRAGGKSSKGGGGARQETKSAVFWYLLSKRGRGTKIRGLAQARVGLVSKARLRRGEGEGGGATGKVKTTRLGDEGPRQRRERPRGPSPTSSSLLLLNNQTPLSTLTAYFCAHRPVAFRKTACGQHIFALTGPLP
jgi:hypothetical protein